jgi:hypothetical protein
VLPLCVFVATHDTTRYTLWNTASGNTRSSGAHCCSCCCCCCWQLLPDMRFLSLNWLMGTNASLSLLPEHPLCCLCCWLQARLHVCSWQPGQRYLWACCWHTWHEAGCCLRSMPSATMPALSQTRSSELQKRRGSSRSASAGAAAVYQRPPVTRKRTYDIAGSRLCYSYVPAWSPGFSCMVSAPTISYRLSSDAAGLYGQRNSFIASVYVFEKGKQPSSHTSRSCSGTKVTGMLL